MSHRGGPDHGDVTSSWFVRQDGRCCCDESVFRVCRGLAGYPHWGERTLAPDRRGQGHPHPNGGMHKDSDVKRETSEIPPSERSTGVMWPERPYSGMLAWLPFSWGASAMARASSRRVWLGSMIASMTPRSTARCRPPAVASCSAASRVSA